VVAVEVMVGEGKPNVGCLLLLALPEALYRVWELRSLLTI